LIFHSSTITMMHGPKTLDSQLIFLYILSIVHLNADSWRLT